MIKESGSNINEEPKITSTKLPKLCYNNYITAYLKKYYPNDVEDFYLQYENLENYSINIYIYKITNNKNIIPKNYFENIKFFF